jgi:hypothetical protein
MTENSDSDNSLNEERFKTISSLKCFICLSFPKSAIYLKCCGKVGCYFCISKWFIKSSVCPHCRKRISVNETINISRLVKNIFDDVDRLIISPQSGTQCEKHTNCPLIYYCTTCSKLICSDCAIISLDVCYYCCIINVIAVIFVNSA